MLGVISEVHRPGVIHTPLTTMHVKEPHDTSLCQFPLPLFTLDHVAMQTSIPMNLLLQRTTKTFVCRTDPVILLESGMHVSFRVSNFKMGCRGHEWAFV